MIDMSNKPNDRFEAAASPQMIDAEFKRRARTVSRAAVDGLLARGRVVSYRESDTPAGNVLRRHPDGRVETVEIHLDQTPKAKRRTA
ncbi:hypothetical protein [Sphingomonas bacterium]|uniref:hypothetical protein n=1 Tax=Sphingomonas bacterium TaxID=1895847 RepID=UPI0015767B69|nr:hypothetical protein [Sphingomonas bacterium]